MTRRPPKPTASLVSCCKSQLIPSHHPRLSMARNALGARSWACLRVLPRGPPGVIGPINDTVLRGVHFDHMQREFGRVPIAPVAAKKVDKKTDKRLEEKEGHLQQYAFDKCECGLVAVWYYRGRLRKLRYRDAPGDLQTGRRPSGAQPGGERPGHPARDAQVRGLLPRSQLLGS